MSGDICIDNRFELIDKYQKILIDRTNITDSPDEMKALYSILYRCWQMGWLDRLDTIADMLDENAKLRELVRDMHRAICCLVVLGDDYAGEHEDELCALDDRMSELGVDA